MAETPQTSRDGGPLTGDQITANFGDLHEPLSAHEASVESARCLYCYDAPCITACPTGIDIPTFIHQIRTGNPIGSAETILEANIMGGSCARVCPTEELCEEACVRNTCEDKPIEIGALQRFAVDTLMANDAPHPFTRAPETGKTVAVVGAGPAGLSAAHRLACDGHKVTVYEAMPKPGGLNEYGIAAYKMVDDFARREVDFLLGVGGIEINYGIALGADITLAQLKADHDAVFIGVGLGKAKKTGLPGSDLTGVEDAIDFIATLRQTADKAALSMAGDDVVVIGGGNTAIDAAIQSIRLGAESVTLCYRRGREGMSATEYEQALAAQNGVTIRTFVAPKEMTGTGMVDSISLAKTALDPSGALIETGKTITLPASRVFFAIGQKLDDDVLDGLIGDTGKISVDDTYQTSVTGVFAGGDCIASASDLTVQAVEDGKRAAMAISAFLRGES